MRRLQRGFELIAPDRFELACLIQQPLGLFDHLRVPLRWILLSERHVLASGVAPGGSSCFGVQHQREQTQSFCFLRQQLDDESCEKDRFVGQVATNRVGTARVGPPFREARIDRLQYGVESMRQLFALGNRERNPCLLDLLLRPRQALAHGGGGDEERGGDRLAIQAEHDLQHQRRANPGFDRRVRAREQQCEALIGDLHVSLRLRRCILQSLGENLQLRARGFPGLTTADAIDQLAARDCEQPAFGIPRAAVRRPVDERRSECFRERVLG